MKKLLLPILLALVTSGFVGCKKDSYPVSPVVPSAGAAVAKPTFAGLAKTIYSGFPETFESGSKTAYAAAAVTLSTGNWYFDNALLGTLSTDLKNGSKSVRITGTGKITMLADVPNGASRVKISYGVFNADNSSNWGLWYSTNQGSTWTQTGTNITASLHSLDTVSFPLNISGNIRFELRKLSGSSNRINIDDFIIIDNLDDTSSSGPGGDTSSTTPTRDDNMAMGNPSAAVTNISFPDNYLMVKTQYALSYNNAKGAANWVSWHLSTAWLGTTPRCDCFSGDGTLPSSFFEATTSMYTSTGFDRGHMCPSADRNGSSTDNSATFLMTNIMPQAPNLNQQPWESLEGYCRTLAAAGYEMYIISGGYGQGGTGSLGGTTNSIYSGSINVSSHYWKVIVILPVGSSDVSRVGTGTRVIAVDMPNTQYSSANSWGYYRTSVDAIESATGYDFLSAVSTSVQSTIEAQTDNGPTN